MKTNLLNRLMEGLERKIIQSAKLRLKESFEGYSYLHSSRYDNVEIRKLIQEHNEKVMEYNKTGEKLAMLFIRKMDQCRPQPQDDFLGALDEWLRLRYLKKHPGVFRSIHSEMHLLEQRLAELGEGKEGIEALRKRIILKRKVNK